MSLFAVVHRPPEFASACEGISDFLSTYHPKQTAPHSASLVGIWLDPCLTGEAATSLSARAPAVASRLGKVQHSISLSGLWTVCWLSDEPACRLSLLEALVQVSSNAEDAPTGHFVPVFRDDTESSIVKAETAALRSQNLAHVRRPLWQLTTTGELLLPPDDGASDQSGSLPRWKH
jgi:hypothetical protein